MGVTQPPWGCKLEAEDIVEVQPEAISPVENDRVVLEALLSLAEGKGRGLRVCWELDDGVVEIAAAAGRATGLEASLWNLFGW